MKWFCDSIVNFMNCKGLVIFNFNPHLPLHWAVGTIICKRVSSHHARIRFIRIGHNTAYINFNIESEWDLWVEITEFGRVCQSSHKRNWMFLITANSLRKLEFSWTNGPVKFPPPYKSLWTLMNTPKVLRYIGGAFYTRRLNVFKNSVCFKNLDKYRL